MLEAPNSQTSNNNVYLADGNWKHNDITDKVKLYCVDHRKEDGSISGTNFFIDEDTYKSYFDKEKGYFDIGKYYSDAEIAPYAEYNEETGEYDYSGKYKNHISCYEFDPAEYDSLSTETSVTGANQSLGRGGVDQIFINDNEKMKLNETDEGIDIPDEMQPYVNEEEVRKMNSGKYNSQEEVDADVKRYSEQAAYWMHHNAMDDRAKYDEQQQEDSMANVADNTPDRKEASNEMSELTNDNDNSKNQSAEQENTINEDRNGMEQGV